MQRFLIILAALALVGCGVQGGGQAAVPTAVQATAAPAATATLTPSITPTPAPAKTPAPTRTPAPTKTPTNTPEPTATPAPVVLTGKGQQVTEKITLPASLNRVTLEHSGARNFIVHAFLDGGQEESLVNAIGRYKGVRAVGAKEPITLEIKADGAWTITFETMTFDDSLAKGVSGTGDYASPLFDPGVTGNTPYTFKHDGKSNFIVHLFCAGGEDSVQNEIGPVDGSAMVKFDRGPCFWDVRADGKWAIAPR